MNSNLKPDTEPGSITEKDIAAIMHRQSVDRSAAIVSLILWEAELEPLIQRILADHPETTREHVIAELRYFGA
jgi:hypothetical protein